jgi:hypothetical protein
MVDNGAYKLSGPCSTEQGVEVNVAYPPQDEGVGLLAVLGATEEGNVKEARDVMGPEI